MSLLHNACNNAMFRMVHESQNRDCSRLGAYHEADSASSTARARIRCRAIAVVIQSLAEGDRLWRARFHAEPAAFALIHIHPQLATVLLLRIRHTRSSPASLNPSGKHGRGFALHVM